MIFRNVVSPKPVNKLILDIMHYVIDSIMATGEYSLNEILLKGYNLEKRIVEYIDNKVKRSKKRKKNTKKTAKNKGVLKSPKP